MSDKAPALHETLRPSMGAAMGRIHRLWRSAINQAVGELGMTEARWAVLLLAAVVELRASSVDSSSTIRALRCLEACCEC